MKGFCRGFGVRIGYGLVVLMCSATAEARPRASTPDYSRDIAIIDRALAGANPSDPWVTFGDVGIKYADLKLYRDRLAGTAPLPKAYATVSPDAVTPSGTAFKWPNGIVPYRFDPTQVTNGTLTELKKQQFRDGVAEWAAFANLTFNEFTGPPPANFITVQEFPAGGEGGFSSAVGMAGGEQFVKIGTTSWNRGTICHEVGHALGLWHEQQRPDRDTYVTINFNNITAGQEGNFAIIADGATYSTPYDFFSVMHYKRNQFAINPAQDTISMKAGFTQYADIIGNVYDRILSKIERAAMATIYGAPAVAPGAVVTNTKDSGSGSLRTAIYFAFDKSTDPQPVATTITFHIPTTDPGYTAGTGIFRIKPTYLLPALGNGTTIDGSSQTGFTGNTNVNGPEVALDGTNFTALGGAFGTFAPGLILRANNCTIKGLTIINFNEWGIWIHQGGTGNLIGGTTAAARNIISGNAFDGVGIEDVGTTGNLVQGNYIGTDQTGAIATPNNNTGVDIFNGASGNTVGGTAPGAGNVISGNTNQGVVLTDAGTNNNLVQGNYIGVNAAGTAAIPNGSTGIDLFGGAQANTIGGTSTAARNVISGNTGSGVAISEFDDVTNIGTKNNIIAGNFIGTNAAGTGAVPNQLDGVDIFFGAASNIFGGAVSNVIGGTAAGAGNVISGNLFAGVTISGAGTNNNLVQGNIIGLNATGSAKLQNATDGVALFGGCQFNIIGGLTAAARNVISGNQSNGVSIGNNHTDNNVVEGNYIGMDPSGSIVQGNGTDGIAVYGDGPPPSPSPASPPNTGPHSTTIGGTVAGARNIISGNGNDGISIGNPGTNGTINTIVQGNYIGLDATGAPHGNGGAGIAIYGGAQLNTIGGNDAASRNIIAANSNSGITIGGNGCNFNQVSGNYVGLNATGAAQGNSGNGIDVYGGAQFNTIGSTTAGSRNFICANSFSGVAISGIGTNNNAVQGNTIGLSPSGAVAGNGFQGVALFQASPSDPSGPQLNTIGGSGIGAGNIIAGNTNEGVALFNLGTFRNTVSHNSIFSNHVFGIALYSNSNSNQPAPQLSSAVLSPTVVNSGGTDISGNYSGTAGVLEFFASPPGNDEGQYFIGSMSVAGPGNFSVSLPAAVPKNYVITVTATNSSGSTSQFSAPQPVTSTDSDGDGIPDNWMTARFGHSTGLAADKSRATDDADGDGLSNLQEFLAGTDPKSSASRLGISSIQQSGGGPRIGFNPIAGKTYRIAYRDDLLVGSWSPLIDGIFATSNSNILIIDQSGVNVNKRFYRLELQP